MTTLDEPTAVPAGFTLDKPAEAAGVPAGFQLDAPAEVPHGFTLDEHQPVPAGFSLDAPVSPSNEQDPAVRASIDNAIAHRRQQLGGTLTPDQEVAVTRAAMNRAADAGPIAPHAIPTVDQTARQVASESSFGGNVATGVNNAARATARALGNVATYIDPVANIADRINRHLYGQSTAELAVPKQEDAPEDTSSVGSRVGHGAFTLAKTIGTFGAGAVPGFIESAAEAAGNQESAPKAAAAAALDLVTNLAGMKLIHGAEKFLPNEFPALIDAIKSKSVQAATGSILKLISKEGVTAATQYPLAFAHSLASQLVGTSPRNPQKGMIEQAHEEALNSLPEALGMSVGTHAMQATAPQPVAPPEQPPRIASAATLQEPGRNRQAQLIRKLQPGDRVEPGPEIRPAMDRAEEQQVVQDFVRRAEQTPIRPSPGEEGAARQREVDKAREVELDRQAEQEIAQQALERFQAGQIGKPFDAAEAAREVQYTPEGIEVPGQRLVKLDPNDPPHRQQQALIDQAKVAPEVARQLVTEWEARHGQGGGDSAQERPVEGGARVADTATDPGQRVAEPQDVRPVADRTPPMVRDEGQPAGDQPGNVGRVTESIDPIEGKRLAYVAAVKRAFSEGQYRSIEGIAEDGYPIAKDRSAGIATDDYRRLFIAADQITRPSPEPVNRGGSVNERLGADKLRQQLQDRVSAGQNVPGKYLERFRGEPWADEILAARTPKAPPSEDAMSRRRGELEDQLRDQVAKELGPDTLLAGKPDNLKSAIMRGDRSPGSALPLDQAMAHAQNLPAEHPARLTLHNLQELAKNPRGTKVVKLNTSEGPDGQRVQVNDKETLTIDREEGVVKDGITVPIPEGGADLYGKKILPPKEGLPEYMAGEPHAQSLADAVGRVIDANGLRGTIKKVTLPGSADADGKVVIASPQPLDAKGRQQPSKLQTVSFVHLRDMLRNGQAKFADSGGGDDGIPFSRETAPGAPIGALDSGGMNAKAQPPPPTAPRTAVDPIPGGKVRQLHDIVEAFGNAIGKKIRTARTQRGAGGTYFPWSTRTIDKFANDLSTSAHEAGHFLDDLWDVAGQWARGNAASPFDAELIPRFSQYGSVQASGPRSSLIYGRAEGIAEWFRAYIFNPDEARAEAPQFTQYVEQILPPKALKVLQEHSTAVREYAGLSAPQKVLSNINTLPEKPGVIERLKNFITGGDDPRFKRNAIDRLKTNVADDLQPVMKATEQLVQMQPKNAQSLITGRKVLPEKDPAILMRNWAGENQKYQDVLENGMVKYKPTSPDQAFERAPGVDGGTDWLLGADLLKGKSAQEVQTAHEMAAARLVSERVLEKVKILQDQAADRISKLDPADPNYQRKVDALNRVVRQKASRMAGFGGGIYADDGVARSALAQILLDPKLNDLTRELGDRYRKWADANIQYWVDSGRMTPQAAERIRKENQQYAAMHRIIESIDPSYLPGAKRLGSVSQPVQRFKGSTRQIESPYVNLLEHTYLMMREADRNAAMNSFAQLLRNDRGMYGADRRDLDKFGSQARPGDKDTIKIYNKGKKEFWQFAPDIHRALKGWGESQNVWPVLNLLMKRLPQGFITHDPGFVVRQLLRDPINRTLTSDVASKPWDVLRSQTPKQRSALKLSGGDQAGHYNAGDADQYHQLIFKGLRKIAGEKDSILAIPGKALEWYSGKTQELGDARSRQTEYNAAFKHAREKLGYDAHNASLYAGNKARGLIDYAVMGRWMRKASPYLPFVNANIQGPIRMWKAAASNPKQFAAMFGAFVLLPRLAMYAWNTHNPADAEEYRQLPAWRRDMFLNFKVGHHWLSIPNPYEAGVIGAGAERLVDAIRGAPHPMEGYGASTAKMLTPVGDGIITGPLLGALENKLNYDFFFGRNVVPDWEQDLDVDLRPGTAHASRLGQMGQKLTGMDARDVDHLNYRTFSGWGRIAMAISDIGRQDRVGDEGIRTATGVLTVPPASSAVDVQWVQNRARQLGDSQSPLLDGLRSLTRLHAESTDAGERDQLAKQLRGEGTKLRTFYEDYSDTLALARKASTAIGEPGKSEQLLKDLGDRPEAQRFAQRHQAELERAGAAKGQRRQLQALRQQMNTIMEDTSLKDTDRKKQLDTTAAELKTVARQILNP